MRRKPKLAVWKFASCDGCQLSLLNCEDELMALASGSIFVLRYPEHPMTTTLKQVAARLMA